MKSIFTLLFTSLLFSLGVMAQGNVIVTKASSDWCPNCGTWGWDYFEALKEEFQTGPIQLISAHKGGSAIENEASLWYTANLNASGQPRFFFNSTTNNVGRTTWEPELADNIKFINDMGSISAQVISFDGLTLNGNEVAVNVQPIGTPVAEGEHRIAVYVFENNVEANQAGRPNAMHVNLMRSSLGTPDGQITDSADALSFSGLIEDSWNVEELGLLAVLYWKEVGASNYAIVNSASIPNFSLVLNSEDILDETLINYTDGAASFSISVEDEAEYEVVISDMSGRRILKETFTYNLEVNKQNIPTGMYVATFRSGKSIMTQQIFVK